MQEVFTKPKKSWRKKLADTKGLPKVQKITGKMSKRWGAGTVVIPAPREVDVIMKKIPRGKLVTINEIRQRLAKKHGATICCPMTAGIFSWIAAHAAAEEATLGRKNITPYWGTLKSGGELNPKYPGGIEKIRALLESEGHTVLRKGKKYVVENYVKSLVKF